MENTDRSDYRLDLDDSFELPQITFNPKPPDFPAPPSLLHRPGYQRISSIGEVDTQYHGAQSPKFPPDAGEEPFTDTGLAIANLENQSRKSVLRIPVGDQTADSTPKSTDFLLSPSSTRVGADDSTQSTPNFKHQRNASSTSSIHQPFEAVSDTENLTPKTPKDISRFDESLDFDPLSQCKSRRDFYQGRSHWLSVSILALAIYSTIFSAIWVLLAIVRPRYGERVSNNGQLSPGTASLLTAAFAKSIELSFVTVFVAFLGQTLSRRALARESSGISIAEMSFRSWIVQPGTMITHWENVQYAGGTFLGIVALIAAAVAIFYTTASESLVSPQLRLGKLENRNLYGRVATTFANPFYIEDNCQTPIPPASDAAGDGPSTCIQIEHAGQAYSNYMQYLETWTGSIALGNGSSVLDQRPAPSGMLYGNTTVTGSWINTQNMTEVSQKYGRIVNNVSMAMPHAGVVTAAHDPINRIIQPQDISGLGEFYIGASVPSPVINVLCAQLNASEIAPLIYSTWPGAKNTPLNSSTWPNSYGIPTVPSWLNSTPVDDLFGFGEKYGRRPPVFAKYPIPYNTILNDTANHADAIYLLATSPTSDYMLCSLSGLLTPDCSTHYHSSLVGGSLSTLCNDPHDRLAYGVSYPNATNGIRSGDWVNVATAWGFATSLNAGISDGQAANARLLTQLIPTSDVLDTSLPSIAEALAVLAGCTALISSIDSPFIHFWNYSATIDTLKIPQLQFFKATLKYQDYASGGNRRWQGIFYIVLVMVFLTNVFCLVHLIFGGGMVTDFIEPQNLFSLSLNSPPSQALAGSCGTGPEKAELGTRWSINESSGHLFVENRDGQSVVLPRRSVSKHGFDDSESIVTSTYSKLSSKKSRLFR